MSTTAEADVVPPPLRRELIVRALNQPGEFVVKDVAGGTYFQVGEQEHFLFTQLDGVVAVGRFARVSSTPSRNRCLAKISTSSSKWRPARACCNHPIRQPGIRPPHSKRRRPASKACCITGIRFFDPDRLLTAIEPGIRFVWSRGFLALSVILMIVAGLVVYTHRQAWISTFPHTITWQTVLLVWALVFVATMLHEFAHGLTCKHFGGEVHEIGFLLMMFMPCLYCNVSDAWLFPEKWKRVCVGLAGAFAICCCGPWPRWCGG